MKLGINEIASCLGSNLINNADNLAKFNINESFLKEKIGFEFLTQNDLPSVSDLCVKAYEKLKFKVSAKDLSNIECLILVSQNADFKLPHSSAILQHKLNLSKDCACFDLGLACSGFVYGLSVILSFMHFNKLKNGLIFTCDTYSKIVDKNDKNTALLFGDVACVCLINETPKLLAKAFKFGTDGSGYESIICRENKLEMNGRAVFDFAMSAVPEHIEAFLKEQNISKEELDYILLHQGSKYIVDNLAKRLKIDPNKAPFLANNYGNTISSSLPLMLENLLDGNDFRQVLITGFGAGLSLASAILNLKEKK